MPGHAPELAPVVDELAVLRLPLVNHLMQQRVLDLGPPVTPNVPPADGDLAGRATAARGELTETLAHAARKPECDRAEGAIEVAVVERSVEPFEMGEDGEVLRVRSPGWQRRWSDGLDGERDDLAQRRSAQGPGCSGTNVAHDGLEDSIGSEGEPFVDAQHPSGRYREHDPPIAMGHHPLDPTQPECPEAVLDLLGPPRSSLSRHAPIRVHHPPAREHRDA